MVSHDCCEPVRDQASVSWGTTAEAENQSDRAKRVATASSERLLPFPLSSRTCLAAAFMAPPYESRTPRTGQSRYRPSTKRYRPTPRDLAAPAPCTNPPPRRLRCLSSRNPRLKDAALEPERRGPSRGRLLRHNCVRAVFVHHVRALDWAHVQQGADRPLRPPHRPAGVGAEGQRKLSEARVLVVGAGGLGSPRSCTSLLRGLAPSASSTPTGWSWPTCSGRSSSTAARSVVPKRRRPPNGSSP